MSPKYSIKTLWILITCASVILAIFTATVFFDPDAVKQRQLSQHGRIAWEINRALKEFEESNTIGSKDITIKELLDGAAIDLWQYDFLTKHRSRYHAVRDLSNDYSVRLEILMLNRRFLCFSDGSVGWIHDILTGFETVSVDKFCLEHTKTLREAFPKFSPPEGLSR